MDAVEQITSEGKILCYVVRASVRPETTTFVTPAENNLQVGYVVYRAKGEVPRHSHVPIERRITGTGEVLVVREGKCEVDVYNDQEKLIATRELGEGDVLVMVSGSHGFRMLQDTVLLEIKQGPYSGLQEKKRF